MKQKILFIANVAKEHILKFHVPTIQQLVEDGWLVDVACGGNEAIPFCNNQYVLPIDRSPFRTHFIMAIRQLREIINKEKYDVVYCHTTVGGIVGRIAARPYRKNGLRVVKFAHGTYFFKDAPIYNYLIYYPLYKILSLITDDIITITYEDFVFTQRHYPSVRAHYVHGIGVDTSRFKITDKDAIRIQYREELTIPQNATVLIYVAELSKNKNQRLLLESLQLVLGSRPNTFLLLVGPDHDDGRNQVLANKLGLSSHVLFLGWRNDVNHLLAASDIYTASSIREGLGLNIIEAMAAGLPVIATNNSGHAEIIQRDPEVGYLVPFDKHAFADRIIELVDNVSLREQKGNAGSRKCILYDNSAIVPQIINILRTC